MEPKRWILLLRLHHGRQADLMKLGFQLVQVTGMATLKVVVVGQGFKIVEAIEQQSIVVAL